MAGAATAVVAAAMEEKEAEEEEERGESLDACGGRRRRRRGCGWRASAGRTDRSRCHRCCSFGARVEEGGKRLGDGRREDFRPLLLGALFWGGGECGGD